MTTCERGSLVLVKFVFADEKGAKQRPVLVVSGESYSRGRREAVVAAVTSHVSRTLPGDYLVQDWAASGLIAPSTITGILRTIKFFDRRLGGFGQILNVPHNLSGWPVCFRRSVRHIKPYFRA